jgi:transglutaminase-like putative cysteine protease
MRFALAHKAATYLVVAFAYLAMITGGSVSSWIALAGAVGLVGSWWWEPPLVRFERWSWIWTIASVLALIYSVLTAIATTDFLGVGAQFLIWLVVAKAYNRRAARDWQQMYLLAFLMLVAGSVLNPDLTYGACFLGFVIAMTWALTLFHLRREMEENLLVKHAADRASERVEVRRILDSKRIVGARFFFGTGTLSFAVFIASAVAFLALPRVGFGFFLKTHGGLTLAGFSDRVKLGGHGVIKNDSTVVMRVEIDGRYGGRDAPEVHWRGVAFDHYERGQWSRSDRAPATDDTVLHPRTGVERHELTWPNARQTPVLVEQDVWLDPLDSDVLFAASDPYAFELAPSLRRGGKRLRNDELRADHSGTMHYAAWSQLATPTADSLRAAHGPLPRGYEVYLQLPPEITPQTYALARQITAGLSTNYDKALAIQRYLATGFTYTLELADPGSREPVDFFLFARKKGHCEYFASAFAVLARAADIPVRQVNGFLGGEWNEYRGYVAVRAGDAHSWDEAFFPGAGWVTFDPTPAAPGGELGRGGDGVRARLARLADTLRFQWTKWVIEYDLAAQLTLFKDIGAGLRSSARAVQEAIAIVLAYWPVLAAMLAVAVGIWLIRRPSTRAVVLRTRDTRVRSAVARQFDAAARQLDRAGFHRAPATTPRAFAAGLADPTLATPLGELVELYYAAAWGGVVPPNAEARATALANEIRVTLHAHQARPR